MEVTRRFDSETPIISLVPGNEALRPMAGGLVHGYRWRGRDEARWITGDILRVDGRWKL